MKIRNEKLANLLKKLPVVLGCSMAAAFLFMANPMEANAIKLGSNPSGTTAPAQNEESDAEENGADEGSEGGTVTSATVTATNVNVRSDASTKSEVAGKANSGMEVTVTGEKKDSDGKTWYAVSFESNGSTVTGYIRSDMVEAHVTEAEPAEPEAPEVTETEAPAEAAPDQEQPAPAPTDDYFVQFEDDGTGVSTWYLHDNMMGTKYKVEELVNAQATNQNNIEEADAATGKLKVIIVVMAVVILILIVVVTVFIIKLKNSYDDDDYDDDDDEEEDDEDEEEEEEQPRKRRFGRAASRRSRYEDDDEEEDDEDEEEEEEYRPCRSQKTSKQQPDKNWQSKNFVDDDDLEFEFLDLK